MAWEADLGDFPDNGRLSAVGCSPMGLRPSAWNRVCIHGEAEPGSSPAASGAGWMASGQFDKENEP